ncbi:MAG: histidine phosphatase family protein [Ectothiorhodospiraceae bacterium]|nr:histidine phosphatase family protein [Ectothiorhodospiraceae bacterium]
MELTSASFAAISLLVCLVVVVLSPSAAADQDSDWLLERLREGGLVVYLRHADTSGEPLDATMDLDDRERQRNLSPQGRDQARRIGRAVKRLGLPANRIATSPVLRARDTAELAFGAERVEVDPMLTADDYVRGSYQAHALYLRQRLAEMPEQGNIWLVGHIVPLSIAVGTGITRSTFPEGAVAVFEPRGDDGFRLLGILYAGWELP